MNCPHCNQDIDEQIIRQWANKLHLVDLEHLASVHVVHNYKGEVTSVKAWKL